jgi:hypothetical protein
MSLQTTTHLNVDFYDKKYIMINAKQYDNASRWVSITCYNQGDIFNLNANKHTVYIRYKKADGNGVLNTCRINYKGEVLVELTEQMLAADGICYVDLIIVNKGSAIVNVDTGEVITTDGSAILSTMAFCINVYEAAIDNSLIESTYEYETNALNDLLQKANADYKEVYQLAKSWAVGDAENIRENENFDNSKYYGQLSRSYAIGDANGVRENENIDNSKYYSELAHVSANSADESEANALASEQAALASENAAKDYASQSANSATASENSALASAASATESANSATESENSMNSAFASADAASASELNASSSATSASNSATSASDSANKASTSEANALASEQAALASASDALISANSALDSATSAINSANSAAESASNIAESMEVVIEKENVVKEYASSVENNANSASNSAASASESASNAHTYYLQVEEITTGLSGAFMPMGTIEFSELLTLLENDEIKAGHLYNISDNFTTDENFKRGVGIEYAAGTNVYMTSDGYFDCLTGTTVTGVKGDKETEYRKGNVNITVENIGAVSSDDVATIDEVISYLGI